MTRHSSGVPGPDALATAQADLRDLQHRLAIAELQQVFLRRAIDAKLIEIDRLEHPEAAEALAKIAGKAGRR